MHHQKLLLSKGVRSAMIPAAFLCVIVSGCTDQQPTSPTPPRVARTSNVPFNRFFIAWSHNYSAGPIPTQLFELDTRQDRQDGGYYVYDNVLSFAKANPGRVYFNGDEPDQYCVAPAEYAGVYHEFVAAILGADPTARVSPAGFAEPNGRCCPEDDIACRSRVHGVGYADQFYNAYVQRYGAPPRVDEWRFHDFGLASPVGDMDNWWARINSEASWSVSHGANMVLGAWGLLGWNEPVSDYQEHLKRAIGRIMNDRRINGAVYWSYEQWAGERHYLANDDGSLTPEGQTYANPLTDIPAGVEIVAAENGRATLRWGNTTSAWAVEAEFWVQAAGSNSFAYHNTELVAGPGGSETPLIAFKGGDTVKGRVRYYNAYGQAGWSSFSNTVSMPATPPTKPPPDQWGLFKKSPVPCVGPSCQKPLHGVAPQASPAVSSSQQ